MKKFLFVVLFISGNGVMYTMEENIPMHEVSQKRKTPERSKENAPQKELAEQPPKKRRRLQRICPSTLREISKQKFVESIPELGNLFEILEEFPEETVKKELQETVQQPLHFEQTRLHQATTPLAVENLLMMGVDPNKTDRAGRTVLNALIDYGHLEAAFYLAELRMGKLDVSTPDRHGVTPLQRAIEYGDRELADLILDILQIQNKLDSINGYNGVDYSAFTLAIRYMPELVNTLITLGADINSANGRGQTPLMFAVVYRPSLIKLLIEKGAHTKIDAKSNSGEGVLDYAVRNYKSIGLLMQYFKDQQTILRAVYNALDKGYDKSFEELVKYIDIKFMASVLHLAISKNPQAIKLLVKHGADMYALDSDGYNSAQYAVAQYQINSLEQLLSAGFPIDYATSEGETLLMQAAGEYTEDDGVDMLRFLISKGADVNSMDAKGDTALSYAINFEVNEFNITLESPHLSNAEPNLKVIKFLLEQDTIVNDNDFKYADDIRAILELLEEYHTKQQQAFTEVLGMIKE